MAVRRKASDKPRAAQRSVPFEVLPLDILPLISRKLPFEFQLKWALASREMLELVLSHIKALTCPTEPDIAEAMLFSVATRPGLIARLEHIGWELCPTTVAAALPLIMQLHLATRLSIFHIELDTGGAEVLTGLVHSNAPLRAISILNNNEVTYSDFNPRHNLSHLAKTLSSLRFFTLQSSATPEFLSCIAKGLPNLETLGVSAETWEPLMGLTKLTHLYIDTSSARAASLFNAGAVAKLLAVSPPGVGPHLALRSPLFPNSFILQTTAEYALVAGFSFEELNDLLEESKYDLNFVHAPRFTFYDRPWGLLNFLSQEYEYAIEELKVILSRGMKFVQPIQTELSSYSSSIFATLMTTEMALQTTQYLFGQPWKEACENHPNPQELLLSDPEDRQHLLLCRVDAMPLLELQFYLSRPDIVGDFRQLRDPDGRDLLFLCEPNQELELLLTYKMDWKQVDGFGLNALTYYASHRFSASLDILLDFISDQEFAQWCTPFVWAGLNSNKHVERMKRLVPQQRWKPCLKAALHASLAHITDATEDFPPLYRQDPDILRMQLESWAEPLDTALLNQLGKFAPPGRWRRVRVLDQQPVHLIYIRNPDHAQAILDEIATGFGFDAALEWATTRNKSGELCTYLADKLNLEIKPLKVSLSLV